MAWIFLPNAMISAVRHNAKPGVLLVRARVPRDLERVFPGCNVQETPERDYRFRSELPVEVVAERMAQAVREITWSNFKSAVPKDEPARAQAYHDIWARMLRLQDRLAGSLAYRGEDGDAATAPDLDLRSPGFGASGECDRCFRPATRRVGVRYRDGSGEHSWTLCGPHASGAHHAKAYTRVESEPLS